MFLKINFLTFYKLYYINFLHNFEKISQIICGRVVSTEPPNYDLYSMSNFYIILNVKITI